MQMTNFTNWRYMTLEDLNNIKTCRSRQELIDYLDGGRQFYGYIIIVRNFLKELKEKTSIPFQAIRDKYYPKIDERVHHYLELRRNYAKKFYDRGGAK